MNKERVELVKRTRKNLLNDIETLRANHKTLKEFARDKYLDDEGFANINIYVNKDNIYNPLTNPKEPELANEIIEQIEAEAHYIPVEHKLRVIMHSKDDLDEAYIEKKLKEHYWKRLADKDDDLKNNGIVSLILFIVGVVLLSAYIVLKNLPQTKDLFNEIFSIAATFTIWEAVDFFFINRNAIKIETLNIAQLALLEVKISDNEK